MGKSLVSVRMRGFLLVNKIEINKKAHTLASVRPLEKILKKEAKSGVDLWGF